MKILVACEFSQIVTKAFREKGHEAYSCDIDPTEGNPDWHIQDDVLNHLNGIFLCKHCGAICKYDHNSFSCDDCKMLWPLNKFYNITKWDMVIAFPPCTYLANSGVQHLHKSFKRWEALCDAYLFFMKLYNSTISKICIENPVPHSYAALPPYTQIIQPYQFGHETTKKTCLWLKNLQQLKPTNIVGKGERYIGKNGKSNGAKWYQLPPTSDRGKHRSLTFSGIADAMADQWG